MDTYNAEYPPGMSVDPEITVFFKEFFRVSDTPGLHSEYVDQFATDATFILASHVAVGRDEILQTRLGMWNTVVSRKHSLCKIFPFGDNATEIMLYGVVELGLRAGGSKNVDWAAHAELVTENDGKRRMKFYQVYLDTGSTSAYKTN